MTNLDYSIDIKDLQGLFAVTRFAYANITFEEWVKEVKVDYAKFIFNKPNPMTFSQWINGQLVAITGWV